MIKISDIEYFSNDKSIKIANVDCMINISMLADESVDSIITDPPYEIGFMGQKWDSTGISHNTDLWKECFRVLKPGGFLLSFLATRTYHRMACSIEDAGFDIRDIIEWIYASGFPKSLNLGKTIPKYIGLGTSLKPAHEPICMARKPLSEKTVIENVNKYSESDFKKEIFSFKEKYSDQIIKLNHDH